MKNMSPFLEYFEKNKEFYTVIPISAKISAKQFSPPIIEKQVPLYLLKESGLNVILMIDDKVGKTLTNCIDDIYPQIIKTLIAKGAVKKEDQIRWFYMDSMEMIAEIQNIESSPRFSPIEDSESALKLLFLLG